MVPLSPVSRARKVALGIAFFVVFVALWSLATLGGFVSKTFPDASFRDETEAVIQRLAKSAPLALRAMKQNFLAAENIGLRDYIRLETERHQRTGASEDSRAAFRAFVEKREPEFQGR